MKRPATSPPKITPLQLGELNDCVVEDLVAHETFEGVQMEGADLSHLDLTGITFYESKISDCITLETVLRSARFIESHLQRLDAPSFTAPRVLMRDVHIDASRFGSFEAYDSELTNLEITNSKLGWLNLRATRARDVVFRNCTFDEISLRDASVLRMALIDCSANKIDVAGANLEHMDLRGLEARAFEGLPDLRGATFSSYQISMLAEVFAAHIGIIVED